MCTAVITVLGLLLLHGYKYQPIKQHTLVATVYNIVPITFIVYLLQQNAEKYAETKNKKLMPILH